MATSTLSPTYRAHSLYLPYRAFLECPRKRSALSGFSHQRPRVRVATSSCSLRPHANRLSLGGIRRALPGPKRRLAIIVNVFQSPGLSVSALAKRLNEPSHRRIRRWLEELCRLGLIDYGPSGARMIARPNPRFKAAEPLAALVAAFSAFLSGGR